MGVVWQSVWFIMPFVGLAAVIYGLWTITWHPKESPEPAWWALTALVTGVVMMGVPIWIMRM